MPDTDELLATALRVVNWFHWLKSLEGEKLDFNSKTNFVDATARTDPVFDPVDAEHMELVMAVFRREWGADNFNLMLTKLSYDRPTEEQRGGLSSTQFDRQYRENLKAISWLTKRATTQ